MPPARARVLYGYLDNEKLKVQATKSYDFNVTNYAERMDSLIRWGFPIINGDTRAAARPPLSSISENEGEIDADVACKERQT
jgi:hypothetical protein